MISEVARKREMIDQLDDCLLALIGTRMRLAHSVVAEKIDMGEAARDQERERAILDRLTAVATTNRMAGRNAVPVSLVLDLWGAMFADVRGPR